MKSYLGPKVLSPSPPPFCFSIKHAALRRNNKNLLNQDNVS